MTSACRLLAILILAASGALVCSEARAVPLTTNLAGYWQFDGNGADASGNGLPVTVNGAGGYATGILGQALNLPNVYADNATRPGDDTAFDFGFNDFSIQIWAKFNSVSAVQVLIEKLTGSGSQGWSLYLQNSTALQFFTVGSATLTTSGVTFTTGTWYDIVIRRNASNWEIDVNGVSRSTASNNGTITTSTSPLLIGERDAPAGQGLQTNGLVDEVAIWTRFLTTAEVTSLYNGGAPLSIQALAAPEPEAAGCALVLLAISALALRRAG